MLGSQCVVTTVVFKFQIGEDRNPITLCYYDICVHCTNPLHIIVCDVGTRGKEKTYMFYLSPVETRD